MLVTILAPVRLVGHDDDVLALAQWPFSLLKFLNGSKDDSTCLAVLQQGDKVLPTVGSLWGLTKELPATAELSLQLLVQILSVRDHHDGYFRELLYKLVGKEHHGKALS